MARAIGDPTEYCDKCGENVAVAVFANSVICWPCLLGERLAAAHRLPTNSSPAESQGQQIEGPDAAD